MTTGPRNGLPWRAEVLKREVQAAERALMERHEELNNYRLAPVVS
jgi:hypothetical protein